MRLKFTIIASLLLVCATNFCQAQNKSQSNSQPNYLTFDPSKSLPGNEIHDRLYFLTSNSESVELPAEIVSQLETMAATNGYDSKVLSAQMSRLKVLYNPRIRKEDKMFLYQRLQGNSESYVQAILPLFQSYLNTNQ